MQRIQPNQPRVTPKALIVNDELDRFGNIVGEIKSQDKKGTKYRIVVQPGTGKCYCNCPDFIYRHAKFSPSLVSTHVCKHIAAGRTELYILAMGGRA